MTGGCGSPWQRAIGAVLCLFVLICAACGPASEAGDREPCRRIVSLSPNITEILFAVGLGDRLVGATRFCNYPPEAALLPRVGGYYDTNVEAVVALEPDLVVMLPAHESAGSVLERVGIQCLAVGNETIGEILSSITTIGRRCGAADSAAAVRASIERRIESVRRLTSASDRPSTLVVVSRAYGSSPAGICAAGRGTFYDELLEAAGGRNAIDSRVPAYPELSMEGMLHLDPEVIIEIVPAADARRLGLQRITGGWKGAAELRAVRTGRVTILTGDHASIPGPRLVLLLEEFAEAISPGVLGGR
ncbi:MAG: helical backbone metal receptor [Candidatus Krumholzibacteria bacterium]|nr:helical backbone metal receptor [Candidatus Krumholzibacteria bacterium]